MPINYSSGDGGGNWLKLPVVGESYDFSQHGKIVKAEKSTQGDFHFTKDVVIERNGKKVTAKENLGYHYNFTFEDGKVLSLTSWKPYYAFRDADIQEGCVIKKINHPSKGQWNIEVLEREDAVSQELPSQDESSSDVPF